MLDKFVEAKEDKLLKIVNLFTHLNSRGLFTLNIANAAFIAFLSIVEDVLLDTPKAVRTIVILSSCKWKILIIENIYYYCIVANQCFQYIS